MTGANEGNVSQAGRQKIEEAGNCSVVQTLNDLNDHLGVK